MIAIIDYQMGNLRSVQKALEKVGHEAIVTSDPNQIAAAQRVILPGVGAFGDAMAELTSRDLVPVIKETIAAEKPFLGICLGLQLLFERGFEEGEHRGLGVLAGEVVRFELPEEFKVPHMGWNQVVRRKPVPLLDGIPETAYFYFVHSYYVAPQDADVVGLETDYGIRFCSMVSQGRLFATQFHPEKSQQHGLEMLQRFAEI